MTVGRTEKPVGTGKIPDKPGSSPLPSVGEGGVRSTSGEGDHDNAAKPVKRHRIGTGSYEDPADEKARKRRPGKTGRPGR